MRITQKSPKWLKGLVELCVGLHIALGKLCKTYAILPGLFFIGSRTVVDMLGHGTGVDVGGRCQAFFSGRGSSQNQHTCQ
jgi:hypothetical protein